MEAHPPKLHGRAFYESIGSPKLILAPMVDRSEFVSLEACDSRKMLLTDIPGMATSLPILSG
jgi:hypothetical protein